MTKSKTRVVQEQPMKPFDIASALGAEIVGEAFVSPNGVTVRDPRVHPVAGDVIRKGKLTRTVTKAPVNPHNGGTVYYTNQHGTECRCWISTWWTWCRKADVERIG